MNKKRKQFTLFGIAILSILSAIGCQNGESTFAFKNTSDEEIYVDRITPLEFEPPCGNLSPDSEYEGAQATAHMSPQKLPEKLTIAWWRGDSATKDPTVIETELAMPDSARKTQSYYLFFQYHGENKWTVEHQEK